MRIGIDVDNTITDTLPLLKEYCKKYNEEVVKRNLPMNEEGFAAGNLYDWTEEEKQVFFKEKLREVFEQVPLKENVKKVIQKLKGEGDTIYIITARTKCEEPYKTTEEFLNKNKIPYDTLVIEKDKKQYCINNNIDILLDDEPHNITSVSEVIPVIVFQAVHNKRCNGNNIIKVDSWDEAYNEITKLKETKI